VLSGLVCRCVSAVRMICTAGTWVDAMAGDGWMDGCVSRMDAHTCTQRTTKPIHHTTHTFVRSGDWGAVLSGAGMMRVRPCGTKNTCTNVRGNEHSTTMHSLVCCVVLSLPALERNNPYQRDETASRPSHTRVVGLLSQFVVTRFV